MASTADPSFARSKLCSASRIKNASTTANIFPIPENVTAPRGGSVNQPPMGARRRTSSLTVIAAVTTRTRTSAAIQVGTANYPKQSELAAAGRLAAGLAQSESRVAVAAMFGALVKLGISGVLELMFE